MASSLKNYVLHVHLKALNQDSIFYFLSHHQSNNNLLWKCMGRQIYFYYLEWLFVYNQNKAGYLQITTLQFYYF